VPWPLGRDVARERAAAGPFSETVAPVGAQRDGAFVGSNGDVELASGAGVGDVSVLGDGCLRAGIVA